MPQFGILGGDSLFAAYPTMSWLQSSLPPAFFVSVKTNSARRSMGR